MLPSHLRLTGSFLIQVCLFGCSGSFVDCLSVAKRVPYAARCLRTLLSQQHFCIAVTSFSGYNLGYLLAFLAENEDLLSNSPVQLISLSETILHKELKARLQLFSDAVESHSPVILFIHDCLLPAVASLQCCDGVLNLDIPLSEKVLRGRQALLRPSETRHDIMNLDGCESGDDHNNYGLRYGHLNCFDNSSEISNHSHKHDNDDSGDYRSERSICFYLVSRMQEAALTKLFAQRQSRLQKLCVPSELEGEKKRADWFDKKKKDFRGNAEELGGLEEGDLNEMSEKEKHALFYQNEESEVVESSQGNFVELNLENVDATELDHLVEEEEEEENGNHGQPGTFGIPMTPLYPVFSVFNPFYANGIYQWYYPFYFSFCFIMLSFTRAASRSVLRTVSVASVRVPRNPPSVDI